MNIGVASTVTRGPRTLAWLTALLYFLVYPADAFELIPGDWFEQPSQDSPRLGDESRALAKAQSWLKIHPCREHSLGESSGEAHRRALALALIEPELFTSCSSDALLHIRDLQHQILLQSTGLQPHFVLAFLADSLAINILSAVCLEDGNTDALPTPIMNAVRQLAGMQLSNGSFGNLHTSALVTQALWAADPEERLPRWSKAKAMRFILAAQEEEGHFGNLLATFQVAPLLAGKTLAGVASHHTSFCKAKAGLEDSASGPEAGRISVWYSLWIGDAATNRSSITVWVRPNATFFDVVQAAAEKDPRFRMEFKRSSLGPYLTSLSGIVQNTETGYFWMAHAMNFATGVVTPLTTAYRETAAGSPSHVYGNQLAPFEARK
ncbi:conserved hypothetical protein [Ixodes scapularis]|uniref:Uncharacterized protein n=1 Tax=Ixodes scapularis TaxID=6945 RepID=B7QBB5_IXOSC|nr:conserved hypothetical protein [Ixodes scapularis]|eukprot:XP_002412841.1 conserved hypothetical protein [Ixodes scapularis]